VRADSSWRPGMGLSGGGDFAARKPKRTFRLGLDTLVLGDANLESPAQGFGLVLEIGSAGLNGINQLGRNSLQ
jgi:hypothetical protein